MNRALGPAMIIASMFVGAAPASAASPQEVTGSETFFISPTCDPASSCKTAGGNLFLTVMNPAVKTGTFEGTQLFDGTIIVFKSGDFVFRGTVVFTGTVDGCGEGTVVFKGEGRGNLATGLASSRQHATGQGTLGVRANLDLINTVDNADGSSTSELTGTYSC